MHIFNYLARRLFASFRYRITDALLINAGCAWPRWSACPPPALALPASAHTRGERPCADVIEVREEEDMPEGVIAAHGMRKIDWSKSVEIDLAGDEDEDDASGAE